MQQFTVPQFIDVEDKIIGPVTTRQFVIILAGCLLIAISYKLFDFSLFVTVGILLLGITGTIAFARINGRPFHFFILNLIQTFKRPGLRVWNHKIYLKEDYNLAKEKIIKKIPINDFKNYPTKSRLAELSLIVDTQGSYKGEDNPDNKIKIEPDELKKV